MALRSGDPAPRPVSGQRPTMQERVWSPLIAVGAVALSCLVLAVFYYLAIVLLVAVSGDSQGGGAVALGVLGLGGAAGAVWVNAWVFRLLGEPAPVRLGLGLCVGGVGTAVLAVATAVDAELTPWWPVLGLLILVFVVVRWRLTGRPLGLRLPLAVAGFLALALLGPPADLELRALWLRTTSPHLLSGAHIDHDAWQPVGVIPPSQTSEGGMRITYEQTSAEDPRIVTTIVRGGAYGTHSGCPDARCEVREGVRLVYDPGGVLREVYVDLGGDRVVRVHAVRRDAATQDLVLDAAASLRPVAEEDHVWLSRLVVQAR